jgi:hypothetical protein
MVLAAGCVERSFVVESNPPGAFVLVNNQPLAASPADGSFVYYGKYNFTLVRDGYETLQVAQDIPTPWYEYWPLDFFVENLWPFTIEDRRRFCYDLCPQQVPNTAELMRRSEELRSRGHSIRPPQPDIPAALPPTLPGPSTSPVYPVPPGPPAIPALGPVEGRP